MSITLNIPEVLASELTVEAQKAGLPLSDYLLTLLAAGRSAKSLPASAAWWPIGRRMALSATAPTSRIAKLMRVSCGGRRKVESGLTAAVSTGHRRSDRRSARICTGGGVVCWSHGVTAVTGLTVMELIQTRRTRGKCQGNKAGIAVSRGLACRGRVRAGVG